MASNVRVSNNSDITVVGETIRKVSNYSFMPGTANHLAEELQDYVAAFNSEPLNVPNLDGVGTIPNQFGRYHVEHIYKLCRGPNLCDLDGEALKLGVQRALGSIANMTLLDDEGSLAVPFDSAANNFHIENEKVILVDLFPPLLRYSDGTFSSRNVQFMMPRIRQRLVPYLRGTREGALLATLFTAALGERPSRQALGILCGNDDWYFDVLPSSISGKEKDVLRKEISRRFVPHFLRNTASDYNCGIRRAMGFSPYNEASMAGNEESL